MINKLKNIYRQLNKSIFVGEKLQSNINALSYVGLAISFCTLITTSMNVIQGSYFMAVTTAFCSLSTSNMVSFYLYIIGVCLLSCSTHPLEAMLHLNIQKHL